MFVGGKHYGVVAAQFQFDGAVWALLHDLPPVNLAVVEAHHVNRCLAYMLAIAILHANRFYANAEQG
jgi:hypothetical protein